MLRDLVKNSGNRKEGFGRSESGTIIALLAIMMPVLPMLGESMALSESVSTRLE